MPSTPSSRAQNHLTRRGLACLRDELRRLLRAPIPPAAPLGTPEDRALTAGLGASIARLDRRIADAQRASEPASPERIAFGADVLLIDDHGAALRVALVGDDETRTGRSSLPISSDAAQALLGRAAGEVVFLRIPRFRQLEARADGSGELSYAYRRYVIASFDYA
jgi:transcription elongation GreA/GreB family factor